MSQFVTIIRELRKQHIYIQLLLISPFLFRNDLLRKNRKNY